MKATAPRTSPYILCTISFVSQQNVRYNKYIDSYFAPSHPIQILLYVQGTVILFFLKDLLLFFWIHSLAVSHNGNDDHCMSFSQLLWYGRGTMPYLTLRRYWSQHNKVSLVLCSCRPTACIHPSASPSFRSPQDEMSSAFRDDDLVVNFEDAVIYGADLAILESPTAWLNDACINFFLTLLQSRISKDEAVFLDPSVMSFFMHQCVDEDDIADFRSGFRYPQNGKLVIPINDNMSTSSSWATPGGGAHWSLLVLILLNGAPQKFVHFDSVKGSANASAALEVAQKLCDTVLRSSQPGQTADFVNALTPQQKNGFDCGLYMLTCAEVVVTKKNLKSSEVVRDYEHELIEFIKENESFCLDLRKRIANEVLEKREISKK